MERTGPPFSPPSRAQHEQKNKHVPPELQRLSIWITVSSVIQGLVWGALSAVSLAVYNGNIKVSRLNSTEKADYPELLANLYFIKEDDKTGMNVPDGLLLPSGMYIFMIIMTAANALWLLVSVAVITAVRRSNASVGYFWLFCWLFCCGVAIVLDVVLGALMVRDLVLVSRWSGLDAFASGSTALLMCPGAVLIYALRAGVLFLANVWLLLRVARTVSRLRRQLHKARKLDYRPSVVDREGPIDAFFYRNSFPGENGTLNPVFVPDEDVNWMTFKAPPPGVRDAPPAQAQVQAPPQPRNVEGVKLRHYQRPISVDDGEDVSHLSWMADVDKYIDSPPESQVDTESHVSVRDLRKKLQEQQAMGSREREEMLLRRSNPDGIPRARLQQQQQQQLQHGRPQVYNQHRPNSHLGHPYQGPQGPYQGPPGSYQQGPQAPYQGQHYLGPAQGQDPYQGRHPPHYQGPQRRPQSDMPPIPPPDYTPPSARRSQQYRY